MTAEPTKLPINVHTLLFQSSRDWTIGEVANALEKVSDQELAHGMMMVTAMFMSRQGAFGIEDRHLPFWAGNFGAISHEVSRRGHDPMHMPWPFLLDDWLKMIASNPIPLDDISAPAITSFQLEVREILAEAQETDAPPEVIEALNKIEAGLTGYLARRDDRPSTRFQA